MFTLVETLEDLTFLNKELLCGSAKVEVIKPEWLKL